MSKTLPQTGFHEIVNSRKVITEFTSKHNSIIFTSDSILTKPKDSETETEKERFCETTDMLVHINTYVRLIFNVQLLNFDLINKFKEESTSSMNTFIEKIKTDGNFVTDEDMSNSDCYNITSTGPTHKTSKGEIQITSWISIDIPYIQKIHSDINDIANELISLYRKYCSLANIEGKDCFYNAKYVLKPLYYYNQENVSFLITTNNQKPNAYTDCVEFVLNLPSDIKVNTKNIDQIHGCKFLIKNELAEETNGLSFSEIIFDDIVKLFEVSIRKIIQKDETLTVAHYTSRVISIFKKDKGQNRFLFNYGKDGKIKIHPIGVSLFENPKSTGVISDLIGNWLSSNTILNNKTIKIITDFAGKHLISKLKSIYN